MTPEGRTFALSRLANAPSLDALRTVWESLSDDYKRDPTVQRFKDTMKQQLQETG